MLYLSLVYSPKPLHNSFPDFLPSQPQHKGQLFPEGFSGHPLKQVPFLTAIPLPYFTPT